MATETVPFTGFAFGDYGRQSPFGVGFAIYRQHLLYKGWWTGQNVMRNIDGSLFPRGGEKPYTLTGVPNGVLAGVGGANSGGHTYIWFAVGSAVYRFRADLYGSQVVETYTGALGSFTEPLAWVDHNGVSYAFAYPAGLYKLDHSAKTVTYIAAGPLAFNCTVHGDRLVAGSASRLYFSAPADFETWPANNYIDIGDAYNITSLDTVHGRLVIGKDGAFGEPWFVLSGVPGVNDVLRQAEISLTPAHDDASVDMGEGVGLITDTEGTLAVFDGSRLHPIPYLPVVSTQTSGIPAEYTVFRLRRPGEWGAVISPSVDPHDSAVGSIWLFRNGAWTRHQRSTPTGVADGAWSVAGFQSHVIFGRGGDASTPATFCTLDPYQQRPPFVSDADKVILDPAGCFFTLPEWWTRDGSEVAVEAVQVDFVSWNTGSADPNVLDVDAVAMRTYDPSGKGGDDVVTTATSSYSEGVAGLSAQGTRRRIVLKYAKRFGNGFRLEVRNLRGVSIEKIVAQLDTRPAPAV